jgi:superfamily II DNA/RNA helicase
LAKKSDSRILVFVKLRASVKNITDRFKPVDRIKSVRFVGQATKSEHDKGLTQTQQLDIIKKFKEGEYNVLISTNVAEEGLDIAECDLVVFYDVVASEIRLIQRKGRTARHREGRVIILYCRDTNDEVYLRIALNRLKRMQRNLKRSNTKGSQSDLDSFFHSSDSQPSSAPSNKNGSSSEFDSPPGQTTLPVKKPHINKIRSKNQNSVHSHKKRHIAISSRLSMKFGIRKRLDNAGIPFRIEDSDFHLVLYERILLQVFTPREFLKAKLLSIYNKLKDTYELIIFIFEFTAFRESFEGEARLFRKKVMEFAEGKPFQVIPIDIADELFFIVKNIFRHNGMKNGVGRQKDG